MSIFLHYQGVPGASTDTAHKGWIDVESVKWGIRRHITSGPSSRMDRESANAETTELIISRRMDKATPGLVLAACCGRGRPAKLHLTGTGSGSGSGSDVFTEYVFHHAIISQYDVLASGQAKRRPLERVVIRFQDPELRYVPFDDDGSPEAPIACGFSTTKNCKI